MASIVLEAARQFLPLRPSGSGQQRRSVEQARRWIFEGGKSSETYVFGFVFICRYLGFDEDRVRAGILALEPGTKRKALYRNGPRATLGLPDRRAGMASRRSTERGEGSRMNHGGGED